MVCTLDSLANGQAVSGVVQVTAGAAGDGAMTFAVDSPEEDVSLADNAAQSLVSVKTAVPVSSSSSGGGGCVSVPGAGFDPVLLGIASWAALALGWSRRRRGGRVR